MSWYDAIIVRTSREGVSLLDGASADSIATWQLIPPKPMACAPARIFSDGSLISPLTSGKSAGASVANAGFGSAQPASGGRIR